MSGPLSIPPPKLVGSDRCDAATHRVKGQALAHESKVLTLRPLLPIWYFKGHVYGDDCDETLTLRCEHPTCFCFRDLERKFEVPTKLKAATGRAKQAAQKIDSQFGVSQRAKEAATRTVGAERLAGAIKATERVRPRVCVRACVLMLRVDPANQVDD